MFAKVLAGHNCYFWEVHQKPTCRCSSPFTCIVIKFHDSWTGTVHESLPSCSHHQDCYTECDGKCWNTREHYLSYILPPPPKFFRLLKKALKGYQFQTLVHSRRCDWFSSKERKFMRKAADLVTQWSACLSSYGYCVIYKLIYYWTRKYWSRWSLIVKIWFITESSTVS
jgi:hypothetical protein